MAQAFFQKNKVFLIGLLTAVLLAAYQLISDPVIDWVLMGYTVFIAAGSYLANNLRGQWATIIGTILPSASLVYQTHQTGGHVDIGRLLITVAIQVGLALCPPPKDRSYEHSETIVQAKAEGKAITDSNITPSIKG